MNKQVRLPSENTPTRPKKSIPNSGNQHGRSPRCQVQDGVDKAEVRLPKDHSVTSTDEVHPFKRRKNFIYEGTSGKFDNLDRQLGHDRGINIDNQPVQVSRRPDNVSFECLTAILLCNISLIACLGLVCHVTWDFGNPYNIFYFDPCRIEEIGSSN